MALKVSKKKPAFKLPEKLSGVTIQTPKARAAFPKLFKPQAYKEGGEPKYSIALLWPKKLNLSKIEKAIEAAKVEAFGKDKKNWPEVQEPMKDGDDSADLQGYAKHYYMNASTKNRPPIFQKEADGENTKITDESVVFGGRECDARICFKVTTNGTDFWVTPYLQGVRFLDDADEAERFGGGGATADSWDNEDDVELDDGHDDSSDDEEENELGF